MSLRPDQRRRSSRGAMPHHSDAGARLGTACPQVMRSCAAAFDPADTVAARLEREEARGRQTNKAMGALARGVRPRERGQTPAGGPAFVRAGRSCVAAVADCKRDVAQTHVGSPALSTHACEAQRGFSSRLTEQRGGKGLLDGDEA
ncbi:hypothetical protein ERJ75_001559500 [Trypanosoma vivax]|nr:hypothetical protein ERJ75_001559500 [Trypanosoma vivax]